MTDSVDCRDTAATVGLGLVLDKSFPVPAIVYGDAHHFLSSVTQSLNPFSVLCKIETPSNYFRISIPFLHFDKCRGDHCVRLKGYNVHEAVGTDNDPPSVVRGAVRYVCTSPSLPIVANMSLNIPWQHVPQNPTNVAAMAAFKSQRGSCPLSTSSPSSEVQKVVLDSINKGQNFFFPGAEIETTFIYFELCNVIYPLCLHLPRFEQIWIAIGEQLERVYPRLTRKKGTRVFRTDPNALALKIFCQNCSIETVSTLDYKEDQIIQLSFDYPKTRRRKTSLNVFLYSGMFHKNEPSRIGDVYTFVPQSLGSKVAPSVRLNADGFSVYSPTNIEVSSERNGRTSMDKLRVTAEVVRTTKIKMEKLKLFGTGHRVLKRGGMDHNDYKLYRLFITTCNKLLIAELFQDLYLVKES